MSNQRSVLLLGDENDRSTWTWFVLNGRPMIMLLRLKYRNNHTTTVIQTVTKWIYFSRCCCYVVVHMISHEIVSFMLELLLEYSIPVSQGRVNISILWLCFLPPFVQVVIINRNIQSSNGRTATPHRGHRHEAASARDVVQIVSKRTSGWLSTTAVYISVNPVHAGKQGKEDRSISLRLEASYAAEVRERECEREERVVAESKRHDRQ